MEAKIEKVPKIFVPIIQFVSRCYQNGISVTDDMFEKP